MEKFEKDEGEKKGGGRDREDRVFDREEEAAMPRCKFRAKKESDI